MSPEEIAELSRTLDEALALEPAKRASWLDALEQSRPPLAQRLRNMLRQADKGTSTTLLPSLSNLGSDEAVAAAGERVGPYRLLQEIGRGGMGSVWLAERADGSYQRKVALKLPRLAWASGLGQRMARERDIGALLEHPSIARLYDAGIDEHGRPYIAMEYIDGQPIDVYCRDHALDLRARLKLFLEVTQAVAYAHGRLVLHRDLKPANVLVDAAGHVHLLDFGIAKLLDDTGAGADLTQEQGRVLTLNYASPEQIAGQPLGVTADVYALGVMLYELLTGALPYTLKRNTAGAMEDAILAGDAPLLSTRVADKRLARALRGDLDAIILKALSKQPEQRYETAAAFADDLERWLDQRPVRAQRSSGWYRVRRFLVRHRFRVIAGTAAIAALLVGGGAVLWQRHIAGEEAARASSVRSFVLAIIAQADPSASRETRDADLALLTTAESRLASELGMHPELALELRVAVAKAYRNRGEYARAGETLRRAIAEARRVMSVSDSRLASAWIQASEWQIFPDEEIDAEVDRAIETMRQLGKEGADLAIEGLQQRARRRGIRQGRQAEAVVDLREAHDLAVKYFGESDRRTLQATVRLQMWLEDAPIAQRLELTGNAYRAALTNTDRTDPIFLEVQAAHGMNLCRAGQGREGVELLRSAVDTARQRHGGGIITERVLQALQWGLLATGDVAAGLEVAREGYGLAAAREPHGGCNRPCKANSVLFAALLARQIDGTAPMLKEAETLESFLKDWPQAMGVWLLVYEGNTAAAAQLAPHAIEVATRRKWPQWVTTARLGWSYALRQDGQPEQADRVLQPLMQDSREPDLIDFMDVLKERASVQLALGNAMQALSLIDESIGHASGVKLQTDPHLSDLHLTRGKALLKLGRTAEARDAFRISDEFWRRYDPASHWAAEASYWLARALIETGDATAGRPMLKAAQTRLAKSPMPSHRSLATSATPAR